MALWIWELRQLPGGHFDSLGEAAYNTAQRAQRAIGLPPIEPQIMQDAGKIVDSSLIQNAPIKTKVKDLDEFIQGDDDLASAIFDYTENDFKRVNLNYLKGKPDPELEKLFAVEGNFYNKSYRGTHLDTTKLANLEEGTLIENKMPLSSSDDDFGPWMYIENKQSSRKNVTKVILEIDNKYNPQYHIASHASLDEGEVLISPRTLMQVQNIDRSGDIVKVEVSLVHPELQDIMKNMKAKSIKDLFSLTSGTILTERMLNRKADTNQTN